MFNKQIKYFPLLCIFLFRWASCLAFESGGCSLVLIAQGFCLPAPCFIQCCEVALRLNPCLGYWPLVAFLAKAPLWFRIGYDLFMGMRACGLMWLLLSTPPPPFHLMHSLDPKWSTVNALFSRISVIPGITSLEELLKNKFWSVSQFSTGNGHWICWLCLL